MRARRLLFWMHLGAGVLVSSLVIFFATTGALLAYERPLVHVNLYAAQESEKMLEVDGLIVP
jgi:hypothetical protein